MIRAGGALWLAACAFTVQAAEPAAAGTTIVGDQDAALGLYLMPWKDEQPADLDRAPGLHDEPLTRVDGNAFARTGTYYATGRAYRAERLQRNH